MQKLIRSYPFFIPLCGLLLAYFYLRLGLPRLWFGWFFILISVFFLLVLIRPKYRAINPMIRVLGVGFLHVGLGLQLFDEAIKVGELPWGKEQRGMALVEVVDDLNIDAKGRAGEVGVLGWYNATGDFHEWAGRFRVSMAPGCKAPRGGQIFLIPLLCFHPYPPAEIPGETHWQRVMKSMGIDGQLRWPIEVSRSILPLEFRELGWLQQSKNSILAGLRKVIFGNLKPAQAGLVYAMLLGDKSGLNDDIQKQFGVGGLMHVLAVSGMHVALIMGALLWIITGFGTRGKPSLKLLLVLVAVGWFYAYLTGSSSSVVRAMISATWVWFGKFAVHRKQRLTHILFGSAYLQMLWNPMVIEQLGFLLSYLAVLGIATFHRLWTLRLVSRSNIVNVIIGSLSITLAATLVTLPLILLQFRTFPTWFLLGNFLLLPLFTAAVYASLVCLMLGWIPVVGPCIWLMFSRALDALMWLLLQFEKLPLPQLLTYDVDWPQAILLWIALLCLYRYAQWESFFLGRQEVESHPRYSSMQRWKAMLFFMVLAFMGSVEWHRYQRLNRTEIFNISHYSQVYRVQCNGKSMRIFGDFRKMKAKKILLRKLQLYCQKRGVERIEWSDSRLINPQPINLRNPVSDL